MRRLKPLLIIVTVLVVSIVLAAALGRSRQGYDPVRDHSSLRTNPWGTKALAELCRAAGLRTAVWEQAPARLTSRVRYLCLFDPTLNLGAKQLRDLLDWVAGGGYLLVAVEVQEPEDDELRLAASTGPDVVLLSGLGLAAQKTGVSPSVVPVASAAPELRDVHTVYVPGSARLRTARAADYRARGEPRDSKRKDLRLTAAVAPLRWETLLGEPERGVLLKARHGAGCLYVLADAQMLGNSTLGERDNVVLAANLLFAPGVPEIHFDEAVHVLRQQLLSEEARELSTGQALPALLALMAALLLYLVSRGTRFGAPLPLPTVPRRSALEFVNAVADLYRRAGARGAVLGLLRHSFRRRLATLAGASPDLPAEALVAAVTTRQPLSGRRGADGTRLPTGAQLVALLQQLEPREEGHDPDERELLALTRLVAHYEEALAHGRRHH